MPLAVSSFVRCAFMIAVTAVAGCQHQRSASLAPGEPLPEMPARGAPAVIFAPGVVSTGDVFASTFTPDNRTVVFTKFTPPRMALMTSSLVAGHWTSPVTLSFSGTYRDLDPAFSPDGRRLYFSSWRPRDGGTDTTSASDTWYVDRTDTGWSAPVRLAEPVNGSDVDMYPSVTRRGVLYFDSFRSQPRRRLVYRSAPGDDGRLTAPIVLDTTVNADSGASNAFIDPDERYLIFAANRPEGRGGIDLYISFRDAAGAFTSPRNLGPTVNTAATEFCPFVTRDGRYLFFTRASPPGVSPATRNIYVVRFDTLLSSLSER